MTKSLLARSGDSALVIVDVQERLTAAMEPAERARVIRNCAILTEAAKRLSVPVLATEQYPKGLGRTEPDLARTFPEGVAPVEKTCFSCAAADPFAKALGATGRLQVILAGMESHVCVLQTALELRSQFETVFVVEDACCSRTVANHANAMARMRAAGIVVTNTESVLFEWLRDARHEQFRAVSALVK